MSGAQFVGIEAEAIARWGEPSFRSRREWRWGRRGSLALSVSGKKRGLWYDHESGRGGRLGEDVPLRANGSGKFPEAVKDEAERIARARALWAASEPIASTLANRYLVETRGIPMPSIAADAVRYHRPSRSLIFAATLDDGTVHGVQLVKLTSNAENLKRCDGSKVKLTFGVLADAMVRLPALCRHNTLLLAEGPETGLSLWAATGHETHIALGGMAKHLGEIPRSDRQIVVCRDDDPPDAPATIALDAAIARARNQGLNVIEATPWPEPRGDKSDFNDVIREHGADAVRARILAALRSAALAAERLTPAEPPFPLPTATPADVYAATLNAVRAFFELSGSPRIIAPGMTGSGKTQNVGKLLPHVIAAAKAERELSGRENAYRAVYMVPAHRLGRQIAQRFTALCEEHGLRVAILEGRGDPWKPEKPSRPYLCRNLEAVGLALQAHQDVRSAVCGSAKGKRRCAFFNECGYLSQFAAAREADVLIVAHTFLFDRLPKSVLHDVAYVIVDEDFTPTGDAIGELPLDVLRPASINAAPALQRDSDEADKEKTEELHRYAAKLVAIFDGAPDGYLADEALDQFPPSDARFLRYLNWKRRRDVGMHPGMSLMERREAFRAAAVNQVLPKIAALTHMLDRGEAARIRLDTDDKGRRKLILHGRRHVANWVSSKPVLMLNATARLPDYQRFFGDAALLPLPQARLEHQHVHQVLGSFGKSAMTDKKLAGLLMEARAHIAAGKSLLVICHEQNEAAFQAIGARTLHHGDLAGDDDHGDVDVIMHIGGPFPDYRKIAELATARSGVSVPIAQPVRRPCFALMEDASGVQFERMAYEHPAAQAVHEGIYDAAFVQGGLGRGRGINRSAATPLEIWIYGNVPLPVPLASLRRWEPVRERALLAAGATHSNGRDLHRFTKEFPSVEAAERWRQRNPFDETRIRQLLADDPRAFVKVTWQPAGQGHKVRVSVCAAAEAPAFRRLAEAEFGRVLQWMVERFTEGKGAKKDEADIVPMNIHGEMSDSLMDPVLAGRSEGANSGHFREHPPDG